MLGNCQFFIVFLVFPPFIKAPQPPDREWVPAHVLKQACILLFSPLGKIFTSQANHGSVWSKG